MKEASKYISSSTVDTALTMCKTASRLEAKTETQDVERVKKWPCSYCQNEFSTRSNRIAHERTSCRNRPPHVSAQIPATSESIVSDHTVSAPAQTHDTAIAATSAQLQVDGKRNESDNLEHGCKPAVETKRDSKRFRQSSLRDLWRGEKI